MNRSHRYVVWFFYHLVDYLRQGTRINTWIQTLKAVLETGDLPKSLAFLRFFGERVHFRPHEANSQMMEFLSSKVHRKKLAMEPEHQQLFFKRLNLSFTEAFLFTVFVCRS